MSDITTQVSSSISALTEEFNAIAHNLANVNTVGYKRICNSFSKSLESAEASGDTEGIGEIDLNLTLDFSQGLSLIETGRSLDFALYGKGFFVIETLEGPLYTRNGMFHLNQNGQIVDSSGRIVSGQAGPITLPANVIPSQIHVSGDGTIGFGSTNVGKFRLVDFKENESEVLPVGQNCFKGPEDIDPVMAENVVVKQGYLESSNVKMVEELVDLIMVSRLYEANMKFISAQKETSNSLMSVAMG